MDIITICILAFTAVCLLVGFLLGLLRGLNRSILRLGLIIVCAVGAFLLKEVITNALFNIQIGGQTIPQVLEATLTGEGQTVLAELSNFITVLAKLLVGIIMYFLVFFALQFLTWAIVFPICKIFVKKGENKRTFVGGAIGLVQGAIVAFVVCMPFVGMLFQVEALSNTINTLTQSVEQVAVVNTELSAGEGSDSYSLTIDGEENTAQNYTSLNQEGDEASPFAVFFEDFFNAVTEFTHSPSVQKVYNSTGSWFFDIIATTTDNNGNRVTLSTTVHVLDTAVTVIADKDYGFVTIMDDIDRLANCSGDEIAELAREFGEKLKQIDGTVSNLDTEGVEMFNELWSGVKDYVFQNVEGMSDSAHEALDSLDVSSLKLAPLGEVFIFVADLQEDADGENPTQEECDNIVAVLAENTFILDIFAGELEISGFNSGERRALIENAIENGDLSDEHKDVLRDMFYLN